MMDLKELDGVFIDNRSGYSLAELALAIRFLGEKTMGRSSLMKETGLGEATVKTMMKKLEDERIAKKTPRGLVLSGRGKKIFETLEKRISDPVVVRPPWKAGKASVAIVVRGAGKKIRKGIEQRDEGIKAGVAVTTLVFDDGKIRFPGARNVASLKDFDVMLGQGDVIIVSSAESVLQARRGGFAVCLTLL
jgi:hypothetical protein